MTDLWIVQPYVPAYRVAFFEGLMRVLANDGISLRVAAGRPAGAQATRGDASDPPWLVNLRPRQVRVGKRTATLTSSRKHWATSDAVIVPLMGSSFDALSALSGNRARRVGVWGHIASFTSPSNPLDNSIERWQMRRADQVFAYTPRGAECALAAGVDRERVTTVMNSIDTIQLSEDLRSISPSEIDDFRARYSIPDGPILAFLGGLDPSKRVGFLAEALEELRRGDSPAHLVVAGSGVEAHLLDQAVQRGQVTMLGYTTGRDKATLLSLAAAVVNPGRVGLLAVDSLVARKPLLTTSWPWHAPEIEYLQEGQSLFTSADDPTRYAAMIDAFVGEPKITSALDWPCAPSLEEMISNYRSGIVAMLTRP